MTTQPKPPDKRKHRELLASARLGVREAQYELGLLYASGAGVKQDFKEAMAWVGKAADSGLAAAQYLLATQYAAGSAAPKDDFVAQAWLARAAEQGHVKAIFRLGRLQETAQPRLAYGQLLKAAELGLAEAQLAVGTALASGRGVDPDAVAALRWLTLAADQGLAAARYALGEAFAEGRGVAVDLSRALHWWRLAAAQDHPAAMIALEALDARGVGRGSSPAPPDAFDATGRPVSALDRRRDPGRWAQAVDPIDADQRYHLGSMFEQGIGAPRNRARAKHWYALAAKQGEARAQSALARLLEPTDLEAALDWYAQAADQGDRAAQLALGRLCSTEGNDPHQAFKGMLWYTRACESGEPLALLTLGHLLSRSQEHIAHDCFRRAAEQGVAQAQFMLGQAYQSGTGVPANDSLAAEWYRRAADQGHAQAQCELGMCYAQGRGVPTNATQAVDWLQLACDQGDAKAQWHLGALYASGGEGVAPDLRAAFSRCREAAEQGFVAATATLGTLHASIDQPEQAVALLQTAARAGDAEARYNLGVLLAKGQGCERDARGAFGWFAKAAEQGIAPAQSRLGLLYATGDGVAMDAIEAHKWFVVAARAGDAAARANRKQSEARLSAEQLDEAERRAEVWSAGLQAAAGASRFS